MNNNEALRAGEVCSGVHQGRMSRLLQNSPNACFSVVLAIGECNQTGDVML